MSHSHGLPPADRQTLERRTQAVYNRNAVAYDRHRSRALQEQRWLDRFTQDLPEGAHILDLGCGGGEPMASYLISRHFQVTGLDFSRAMLALAARRFPDQVWIYGDMRDLNLATQFDGILGWDSFFHLTHADQRATLPKIAQHLLPGGRLMLTVGPRKGEVTGQVNGEAVYHASLSPQEYGDILLGLGLTIVEFVLEDQDCGQHTILLARRLVSR